MTVGLYFGSFNPIHIGHLAIANYVVEFGDIDQLWFVISPQNPFKTKKSLLPDYYRLELVERAIGDADKFRASNIEFALPKPSYTIDTLAYLHEKHPQHNFRLIMGADSLANFHRWKNYQQILAYHSLIVYPRPGVALDELTECYQDKVQIVDAPLMELSATFIRNALKAGKDMRFFVPPAAYDYIDEMNFYRQ